MPAFDLPAGPFVDDDGEILRELSELVADFGAGQDPIRLTLFTDFNIEPKMLEGEENTVRYGNTLVDVMEMEDIPYGATISFKTHTLGNTFRSILEGNTLVKEGIDGEVGYTESVTGPVNSVAVNRQTFDLYVKQMIRSSLSDTGLGYRIWKIANCRGTGISQNLMKDNFTELEVKIDSTNVGGTSAISYVDRKFSSLA